MDFTYQSAKRLDMLKSRAQRCVCKSCGGALSLRQIDFNDFEDARIEIFCDRCDRLEFGIEPEIFASAQYYVDEFKVNFYPDMGDNALTRKMSVAGIASIMSWALQDLGYLNKDGFVTPPHMEDKILGECLVLNDQSLEKLKKELES